MTQHLRFCCSRAALVLALLGLMSAAARSQSSFEDAVKSFAADDVKGYVQPLADVFGADMNIGWFRSAEIPRTGFSFSFSIIGMGAAVSADQETYTAKAPPGYNPATFETATVFGKKGGVAPGPGGTSFTGSDGVLNVSLFPLAALQVTLGHLYGTELIVRGVPLPEISGVPKITFWGVGGRHSVSQYFGNEPVVDVAFGVFYSKISLGDLVNVSAFSLGPQISKSFSILELYGALAYEKNSMDLSFTSTTAGSPSVNVTLDGENNFHGTLGAALNLGIFHIHADGNFGSLTSFSTGISFGN